MELNLSAISLAGISAPNGIGKSSFFTHSIVFALYGKPAPGCSLDDMVMKGQQDMLVTVDFEHNGEAYQVTRTRSLKGKGKSTCEFQKQTATGWKPLTGATIKETDEKIEQLLNLDASTFLASSLIMQGDASNFTKKLPGERKAILTQILGLEVYDKLQSAAKEREKSLTIELETSKNKLLDLEEKLQALPEVEEQMKDIDKSITLNSIAIREKETALSDAQAQVKDLEGKEQQAKDLSRQMDAICTDIKAIDQEIADHDLKIQNAKRTLMDEADILAKVAELDEIKAQIPALQAKEDRIATLKADEKRLDKEQNDLFKEKNDMGRRIYVLADELSCRAELKQASEDYQQGLLDLKALDEKAEQWRELERQENAIVNQLDDLCKEIKNLQTTLRYHEKKISILHDSGCIDPENAKCLFLKDARESQLLLPSVQENIEELQKQCEPLMVQSKAFTAGREALSYDSSYHADLKKRVESLRTKAEAYSQLEGKEELLKNLEGQRDATLKRLDVLQDSVDSIKQEVQRLQAETESLPILKAKIPTLEKYVTLKDKLPEARATIKLSQESIAKLQTEIEQKDEQYRQLMADYTILSADFAGELPSKRLEAETIEGELKGLQSQLNSLFAAKGTCQGKLDSLTKDAEELDRLKAELAPKAKELVRWQTLVKAFSKNGIPALIIENSVPELERISNDILSQMSNGSHSLRFETQRDLKSKDGVAETLDIIVNDWAGSRPYETYSGGEQLRIDLAIRLGLAELLANRAGSKIEFLVMDEVFGSQDSEHRELVIDAIKSVADRFKLVLVISHITETQSAFDQQVVLGEGGKIDVLFS
jgi:exonuclease SbcC